MGLGSPALPGHIPSVPRPPTADDPLVGDAPCPFTTPVEDVVLFASFEVGQDL
ncbi:MAG TPA: hypothetical protein VK997_10110 [Deferrisomatales bacterium]|nr:hypothetical protein [Deferrisomatales bacterium]